MTAMRMPLAAIYLAIYIPDWNSLDSVRLAHSRLELSSIVFFGLLAVAEAIAHKCKDEKRKNRIDTIGIIFFVIAVLCEGAAYPYGQRNDALSEQVIGSLDAKAQQAADTADRAKSKADAVGKEADQVSNKILALSQRATSIDLHLAGIEYADSARFVQDEDGMTEDLRKDFKASHIVFRSYAGDPEAYWLCQELTQIADKAGVEPVFECAMEPIAQVPSYDLILTAPDLEQSQRLGFILLKPGRVTLPGHTLNSNIGPLKVFIGAKASVRLWWPKMDDARRPIAKKSNKRRK